MVKSRKNLLIIIILIMFLQINLHPLISQGCEEGIVVKEVISKEIAKVEKESVKPQEETIIAIISDSSAGQAGDKLGIGNLNSYRGTRTESKEFTKKIETLLTQIRIIGIVLSVVILIVIGIKYLFGSVEEKADYKKTLIPYLWGAVFVFASSVLPQIIYEFAKNIGWM